MALIACPGRDECAVEDTSVTVARSARERRAKARLSLWRDGAVLGALALFCLAFSAYVMIGLLRYNLGGSGNYDLGIFSQAAKAWASGRLPSSPIRNVDNLFADHFSPITALFGAAWSVWSDPRALILLQGAALALAVGLVGWTWLSWRLSWVTGAVLLLVAASKGLVSAAFFDVHEVSLGVPAMAGLSIGLLTKNSRLVWVCAAVLLLVKEDLGITVAVAGLIWFVRTGNRRSATKLMAFGIGGAVVAFVTVYLVSGRASIYVGSLMGESSNPLGLAASSPESGNRLAPAFLFLLTAGIVGVRSPIAALAIPTLAWRALSSNPAHWQTYFHYDSILVPVAAIALLDVIQRGGSRRWVSGAAAIGLVPAAFLGVAKVSSLPLTDGRSYRMSGELLAVRDLVREVPVGSGIAAQQDLGPQLVSRYEVHMLSSAAPVRTRWVVLADGRTVLGAPERSTKEWLRRMESRADVVIRRRGRVALVILPSPEDVQLPG
jgi:uncharacterized membrane protein